MRYSQSARNPSLTRWASAKTRQAGSLLQLIPLAAKSGSRRFGRVGDAGDVLHHPGVHIGEHLRGQFVAARILANGNLEGGGVKQRQLVAQLVTRVALAV